LAIINCLQQPEEFGIIWDKKRTFMEYTIRSIGMDMMNNEVKDFYNMVKEKGRLEKGLGKIEFYRTKEILSRLIPEKKQVIYDIGGGIGVYSAWLAEQGHEVHMFELAPAAVEYAINNQTETAKYIAEEADARNINRTNESADVVLLMGPLYHLTDAEDRIKVLREAYRVLKKGGILVAVAITKYCNAIWSIDTYGLEGNYLEESVFQKMVESELGKGVHYQPQEYPEFFIKSFFHSPELLQKEVEEAGFVDVFQNAIESCIWLMSDMDKNWEVPKIQNSTLQIIHQIENDTSVMGMSPHFMAIGKK
jgi:2-polyprenyl-3-methyl-5-hydroxy-6-metoxy-1,4-benzoquinol methylase